MAHIGILVSAHGFGHLARELAVAEALLARGCAVEVWTAAPPAVVHDYLPGVSLRSIRLDVGLVQRDSLHEDLIETAEALKRAMSDDHIDGIAALLREAAFDAVIVDIAPMALEAARRAQTPALAVGNFDWAWTYSQYPGLAEFAEQCAHWQAAHDALRMEPGPPLHHFAGVEDVGVVGRWRPAQRPSGVEDDEQLVLVSFGGLGLDGLDELLPRVAGVRWLLAPPMAPLHRSDCLFVEGLSYPALVGGADRVLTKPGYGIFTECALAGTPVLLVRRPGFPESAFLEPAFSKRGDVVLKGNTQAELRAELASVLQLPAPRHEPFERHGAGRVAERVLELVRRSGASKAGDERD